MLADAFISYAHLDNLELFEGHQGWVSNLYRALDIRLAQLHGRESRVWWDPKLQGNDCFDTPLVDRLRQVAAFVAVVSPLYVRSEWARRELAAFCEAADSQGGVCVHGKARIFKVLKTPVPLEQQPAELQSITGYEFFKVDPETGRVRELDEIFGPEAQRDFWIKLDDLARDIGLVLQEFRADRAPESTGDAVYLAETTSDLKSQREVIRRDLEQHGYTVTARSSAAAVRPRGRGDGARRPEPLQQLYSHGRRKIQPRSGRQ